jgi:hypothetical protein
MAKEVLEMEVKSNIKSVTKDTDKMTKSVKDAKEETKGLAKETEEVGEAAKKSSGGVKTLAKGFGSLMKSLGIVALIATAFTALKEALDRNQKVMNVVNNIMSTISITFNQVVDVLTDTVKWVTESSDRFDGLGKVLTGLVTIGLTPLKLAFFGVKLGIEQLMLAWEKSPLGGGDEDKIKNLTKSIQETKTSIEGVATAAVNAGGDIVNNFGDAIGEIGSIGKVAIEGVSEISIKANHELAKATTEAVNSSALAEAAIQGLIEKYDRQAELQRQIRDDETKTFEERIEANKKLGEILNEQEQEMLKLADARVASAALELSANEDNIELQVAYKQALNDRAGVEAQVAGFRSEQLTNQVSLEKELGEVQNEVLLAGLEGLALELAELERAYELKLEMARKAGADTAAITEQYEKEKATIVKGYQKEGERSSEELAKNQVKWAEMTANEKMNLAAETAGNLSKALGEETAAGKAAAIVQATIDTYKGATAAYSSMAGIPVVGPVLGGIAAAAAVASGIANVKAITSAGGGGGGGGGISNNSTASEQPPAPQMMSGSFDLTGGEAPEPIKTFVVTDEMTSSQAQLANIRRRATI